jgi:hypothetical protein
MRLRQQRDGLKFEIDRHEKGLREAREDNRRVALAMVECEQAIEILREPR